MLICKGRALRREIPATGSQENGSHQAVSRMQLELRATAADAIEMRVRQCPSCFLVAFIQWKKMMNDLLNIRLLVPTKNHFGTLLNNPSNNMYLWYPVEAEINETLVKMTPWNPLVEAM